MSTIVDNPKIEFKTSKLSNGGESIFINSLWKDAFEKDASIGIALNWWWFNFRF